MTPVCREHPAVPAWYRCDECGRFLCDDCVDVRSRLAICLPCGGLARPLPQGEPEPEPIEAASPLDLTTVLAWPIQGIQGLAFAFCAVLMAVPVAAELLFPPVTCLLIVPRFLVAILIPGILADATRATAEGLASLPEWPRYPTGRFGEVVRFVGAGLLALLPAAVLLGYSGCAEEAVLQGRIAPACHLLLLAGLWIGAFLWLPLYGATVLRASFGDLLDFPAHARVLRRHPRELAVGATLCTVPLAIAATARSFAPFPAVGGVIEVVFALYGALLGAHLTGLFLLRHREELEDLYVG